MLAYWARSSVGRAAGAAAPKRLVLLHRPNGSISEDWLRSGQRGPILEPFAGVWPYCVALKGVNVKPNGTTANGHEGGLLTQMTGAKLGPTFRTEDDYRSTAESLDQKLLKQSAALNTAPIQSLQLGAHGDQDGGNETPNCTMSYSGPDTPLYPNLSPDQVYSRLFANIMPGGMTDPNMAELAKARARRKSVLDFVSSDLGTVRAKFPTSFKEDLDIHEAAIRELEMSLDSSGQPSQVDVRQAHHHGGCQSGRRLHERSQGRRDSASASHRCVGLRSAPAWSRTCGPPARAASRSRRSEPTTITRPRTPTCAKSCPRSTSGTRSKPRPSSRS